MLYEEMRSKLLSKVRDKIHANADRLNWTAKQIQTFQQAQLKKLLDHAQSNSAYYRSRCQDSNDFTAIPVSTKQDIMTHWNDIVCIPKMTKSIAENHLTQYRNNIITNPFLDKNYYITSTGGSSGLRGLFVWDLDYFATVGYAAFRYQYHDELMNPIKGSKKVATLTAPTLIHASTPLFTITLDDQTEVRHIPVDLSINEICNKLNEFQPTHLIGYSSVMTELAYRALGGYLKISPQRVSTNSEPLTAESRVAVRKAWNIEINNMWGSVEMGMAGIESDKHCGLFVSDDLLIIESVDENLKPVLNTEEAKKLIITNLFNFSFPLIRYVVDDTVAIKKNATSGYRIAKDIMGRSDAWFVYPNNIQVHPMAFRNTLGQESAITEYQVEQTIQGAIIRLVVNAKLDLENLQQRLRNDLQKVGLSHPVLQIEIVNDLPRHMETGKLRRFIPLLASQSI